MTQHKNVYQALLQVQAGMAGIKPKARGSKGNLYIDLDLLLSKARPLCAAAGLVIVHDTKADPACNLMVVRSGVVLATVDEEQPASVWVDIPVGPQNPGVTREEAAAGVVHWAPHAIASAFSYGRRYGLSALFAVSERDDDATVAQQAVQAASTAVRQPVSQSDKPASKEAPKAQPFSDKEERQYLMVTMIHCAKMLGLLDDSAADVPTKANINTIAVMVGEHQGLDAGKAANLKATTTAALAWAAEHWQDKADEANDIAL